MIRIVFRKNSFTLKPNIYLKLGEIQLNNKKNMIELIERMEELIYQQKSHWTIKYVIVLKLMKYHNELSYCIGET